MSDCVKFGLQFCRPPSGQCWEAATSVWAGGQAACRTYATDLDHAVIWPGAAVLLPAQRARRLDDPSGTRARSQTPLEQTGQPANDVTGTRPVWADKTHHTADTTHHTADTTYYTAVMTHHPAYKLLRSWHDSPHSWHDLPHSCHNSPHCCHDLLHSCNNSLYSWQDFGLYDILHCWHDSTHGWHNLL